jgi:ribosomal protein S18 acetylase RimI-like enzyme
VTRGVIHHADKLPGYIAEVNGQRAGLLTYNIRDSMLEIVTLNVLRQREGIGRKLVNRAISLARSHGCSRVWVITTNDNTHALQFYQTMSFKIARVHKDAIEESRKLKPEIPRIGMDDIPITDEIELEMNLKV